MCRFTANFAIIYSGTQKLWQVLKSWRETGSNNTVCFLCPPTVAVVGLEETLYRVMEGVGTVEVCAIFYQPPANVACPTPFPFDVSISTRNGTAGNSTFRSSFSYRKWDSKQRLSKATRNSYVLQFMMVLIILNSWVFLLQILPWTTCHWV